MCNTQSLIKTPYNPEDPKRKSKKLLLHRVSFRVPSACYSPLAAYLPLPYILYDPTNTTNINTVSAGLYDVRMPCEQVIGTEIISVSVRTNREQVLDDRLCSLHATALDGPKQRGDGLCANLGISTSWLSHSDIGLLLTQFPR